MPIAMRNPRLTVLLLGLLMISCKPQAQTLPDFTGMADKHGAAVVNISTVRSSDGGDMRKRLQGQLPDFLEDFMGERFGDQFGGPKPSPKARSMGSGFIISDDGYVLTNYHVIAKSKKVNVQLRDRREFEAEIVGTDQQSDLALLKVDASGLPTAKIGSSEGLQVGEWVVAIGAPFGFENTITKGIVSAKGRSLPNENYVPFIQTDAAVNPGNSGGPLFNMDGEVVGVNSQIVSRSGGFNGLSFAVPIDMAMNVVDQLKQDCKVSRGWLGVMIQEVDRDLAQSFDMDRPRGALVAQVMSDSPAQKAGFKPGDIVIEFEGQSIETSSKLPHIVGRMEAGSEAEAVILREGERRTLDVTVGKLPKDMAQRQPGAGGGGSDSSGRASLGLTVEALSDAQRKQLDVPQGVKVTGIKDGPAARAGIRPGDVIVTLANQPVTGPDRFHELASALEPGVSVPVLVSRKGNPRFLALRKPGNQ